MVFIRLPFKTGVRWNFLEGPEIDINYLRRYIASFLGSNDFGLYCNGKELRGNQYIGHDATVFVSFFLPGGKGGFGSMLRAIGAQIEKTTNREACRDLSGRRLRDINEEQRLRKWLAKETEREAEKIRKRKERIERLKSQPKHNFVDFEYEKEISQLPERIDDALAAGMQKASKRPVERGEASCSAGSSKKKRLWLDDDLSGSSENDSDSQERVISEYKDLSSSIQNECSSPQVQELDDDLSGSSENDSDSQKRVISEYKDLSSSIQNECSSPQVQEFDASESETLMNIDNCEKLPSISDEQKIPDQNKSATGEAGTSSVIKKDTNSDLFLVNVSCPTEENTPTASKLSEPQSSEKVHKEDEQPLDLLSYNSMSDLEHVGLDRLKSDLTARGLKCGGNAYDRAQRLWKVRGLEPHEYPANLLAKIKK